MAQVAAAQKSLNTTARCTKRPIPDKKCVILVPVAAAQKLLGATARCTKPAVTWPSRLRNVFLKSPFLLQMMWCSHLRYRNFITPNNILQQSKVQRHAASISNLCTVNSWDACLQRRLLSTSDSLQTLCRHLQPSDCDCSSMRRITIRECKRIWESRNILEWGGRGHPPCNKLWYQRYMQLPFVPSYCCPEICLCICKLNKRL